MNNIAVIFAGGSGVRMHAKDLPKQFLSVHGKPIILRTVQAFEAHPLIDSVVISCVDGWLETCEQILNKGACAKVRKIVPGGMTGQLSIYNGILAAKALAGDENPVALIHDGVRPLIDLETITSCIDSVKRFGSAITCVPAKETVIRIGETEKSYVDEVVDRNICWLARAPQCFWLNDLLRAHEAAREKHQSDFVDSASLMSWAGHRLHIVEGKAENIKVTTPDDFYSLQAMLNAYENAQMEGSPHV